jgi:hypothetical protein
MAVTLNQRAFNHAKNLIKDGKFVLDGRDSWSEHKPTTAKAKDFLETHGMAEYSRWFLGIDDSFPESNKRRYKFPYGDFEKVHRCGVLSAESRAGQYKHLDIEQAVAHIHGMLEQSEPKQ